MTLIPNPWVSKCCYARLPSSWRAFNKFWNLTAGFGCPELRLDTKGDRIRAPRLWTKHPEEIRLTVSVTSFKTHINWLLCQVTLFRLIFLSFFIPFAVFIICLFLISLLHEVLFFLPSLIAFICLLLIHLLYLILVTVLNLFICF